MESHNRAKILTRARLSVKKTIPLHFAPESDE